MEEQRLGTGAPGSPAVQSPAAPSPAANVAARPNASQTDAGTEIRIPGLGKLGTLPKMDFGLDLLYGVAGDQAESEEIESPGAPQNDLTIRGSVKHRF